MGPAASGPRAALRDLGSTHIAIAEGKPAPKPFQPDTKERCARPRARLARTKPMRLAMGNTHGCRSFAVAAIGALALGGLACGSDGVAKKDSATSTAGGDRSLGMDGAPVAGGARGSGGISGSGGSVGTGGATSTGSATVDASDVATTFDGGLDAPAVDVMPAALDATVDAPAAETSVDSATQPCGNAACRPGQACALVGGGPAPPCMPTTDAGTCADDLFTGLVLVASCSQPGGAYHQPGCTTPPASPQCYDLPAGCEDYCSCVCQPPGGHCSPGPGYYYCGYP